MTWRGVRGGRPAVRALGKVSHSNVSILSLCCQPARWGPSSPESAARAARVSWDYSRVPVPVSWAVHPGQAGAVISWSERLGSSRPARDPGPDTAPTTVSCACAVLAYTRQHNNNIYRNTTSDSIRLWKKTLRHGQCRKNKINYLSNSVSWKTESSLSILWYVLKWLPHVITQWRIFITAPSLCPSRCISTRCSTSPSTRAETTTTATITVTMVSGVPWSPIIRVTSRRGTPWDGPRPPSVISFSPREAWAPWRTTGRRSRPDSTSSFFLPQILTPSGSQCPGPPGATEWAGHTPSTATTTDWAASTRCSRPTTTTPCTPSVISLAGPPGTGALSPTCPPPTPPTPRSRPRPSLRPSPRGRVWPRRCLLTAVWSMTWASSRSSRLTASPCSPYTRTTRPAASPPAPTPDPSPSHRQRATSRCRTSETSRQLTTTSWPGPAAGGWGIAPGRPPGSPWTPSWRRRGSCPRSPGTLASGWWARCPGAGRAPCTPAVTWWPPPPPPSPPGPTQARPGRPSTAARCSPPPAARDGRCQVLPTTTRPAPLTISPRPPITIKTSEYIINWLSSRALEHTQADITSHKQTKNSVTMTKWAEFWPGLTTEKGQMRETEGGGHTWLAVLPMSKCPHLGLDLECQWGSVPGPGPELLLYNTTFAVINSVVRHFHYVSLLQ